MSSDPNLVPKESLEKKRNLRMPAIEFRLLPDDYERFERIWRLDGKSKAEIVRDAVHYYLDAREGNLLQDRDTKMEKQIKRGFDRIAAMQSRNNIDLGVIYQLIYNNLPQEKREGMMRAAYKTSVQRLRAKITQDESEIKDLIQ